jgi:hypothetical protein
MEFEHGEISGHRIEGKKKNVAQAPPNFDVAQ